MRQAETPVLAVFLRGESHGCCPVCAGPLLQCGSMQRCTRCQFALCAGCGDGPSPEGASREEISCPE